MGILSYLHAVLLTWLVYYSSFSVVRRQKFHSRSNLNIYILNLAHFFTYSMTNEYHFRCPLQAIFSSITHSLIDLVP